MNLSTLTYVVPLGRNNYFPQNSPLAQDTALGELSLLNTATTAPQVSRKQNFPMALMHQPLVWAVKKDPQLILKKTVDCALPEGSFISTTFTCG